MFSNSLNHIELNGISGYELEFVKLWITGGISISLNDGVVFFVAGSSPLVSIDFFLLVIYEPRPERARWRKKDDGVAAQNKLESQLQVYFVRGILNNMVLISDT